MSETQLHEHRYPDGLPMGPPEYVKVEMTTKGPKWEVKATSPERLGTMFDQLMAECEKRGIEFGG